MLLIAGVFLALLFSTATTTSTSPPATPLAPPSAALDEVCGRLGGYYVTPTHCSSTLCSSTSPCRTLRDAPSVATLAARLAADNATAARDSIQSALSSSSSSAAAAAARSSCLQLYAGAVPALRWAAKAVAEGRYRGATEVLQAAQYVASGCEGMAGDAANAVLPRENGGFGDMAFVAHAVVASMAAAD
ncbi:hypothetical protein HU200_039824 [Digitaria exilis]|uniref:Pectinesterase inhibitor domain-containing protein n=1 Tax=Digitaria exilis TaxID=1010633 RepID=A0A835BI32_9POAL|nr:hypothetical protein HU200_039824 [Digitaria exilis]